MKPDLNRIAPPGMELKMPGTFYLVTLGMSVLGSTGYLTRYRHARDLLFRMVGRNKILVPGAVMPDFRVLLEDSMQSFILIPCFLLALVIWNYLSYRHGSMSIYLMRRLPDRSLLHRQCWTLPLIGLVIGILLALGVLLLYYLIYRLATPPECLRLT